MSENNNTCDIIEEGRWLRKDQYDTIIDHYSCNNLCEDDIKDTIDTISIIIDNYYPEHSYLLFIDKYLEAKYKDIRLAMVDLIECFCSIVEQQEVNFHSSLGYYRLPLVYFMSDFLKYDPNLLREYMCKRITYIEKYRELMRSYRDVLGEIMKNGISNEEMKKTYYVKKLAMKTAENNKVSAYRIMCEGNKRPYVEFIRDEENYIKFMKYVIEMLVS